MNEENKAKVKEYVERLLNDITPFSPRSDWIHFEDRKETVDICHFDWTLYTTQHRYTLTASYDKPVVRGNYLGATVSTRKPRPGEDWSRGSDLPDGRLNQKTWTAIKHAIIRYEMLKIQPGAAEEALERAEGH